MRMLGAVRNPLVLGVVLLALFAGCSRKQPTAAPIAAPDFTLTSIDGGTIRLSDYRGKVVLLDFWATWCPPCRAAIPHVVELQQALGPQGFAVIGMNLDENGEELVAFLQRNPVNYPIVRTDDAAKSAYGGVNAIPHVFLIDRKGMIREQYTGYTKEIGDRMRQTAEALLKEST
ncbi:MAG: TlpA family protein disulfide reductase [Deltaproteobacteria bacterium]|nr:TlpA family protein disulfide reductase [Deltaproteobacteria bacterium]